MEGSMIGAGGCDENVVRSASLLHTSFEPGAVRLRTPIPLRRAMATLEQASMDARQCPLCVQRGVLNNNYRE